MKKVGSYLNMVVAISMVFALFAFQPAAASPAPFPKGPGAPHPPLKDIKAVFNDEALSPEAALEKIDPSLRPAVDSASDTVVKVYVTVKDGVDLSGYLDRMIVRPAVFGGVRNVYGYTSAAKLLKIAQLPGVVAIVGKDAKLREKPFDIEQKTSPDTAEKQARLAELRSKELSYADAAARQKGPAALGWFDVLDGHKSSEAWKKGFTGQDVIVGVLDDGIDFAHPDLQGTTARVTDEESPYYGWPMAFSQVSTEYFVEEVLFQDLGALGITEQWAGSRWADASTEKVVSWPFGATSTTLSFKPLDADVAHTYRVPTTSQSKVYKLTSLPEMNLLALYGERVAVLVVDEWTAGVYDTVYVDLDNDYDFTDEKPATIGSPEIYRDMDGDGYADISGGQLVWISDGVNPPPTVDWLWGISCGDEVGTLKACPDPGELLIFAGPFDEGYTHGTQCASNIAGQGVVNGGLSAPSFRIGGMVQGAAPDVGLMDFGNHYYNGTDEDEYLVVALGYDGIPASGDEVQIASNSYGNFTQMWGGWGYFGRLVTALNMSIAPTSVWVFSGGNEGPGYGPQEGEGGPTIIKAGTSTQYGSTNWDSITGIDQIVYGDPSSFGAKGPNRDGSAGLDVLGNGGRGAGDEGLNYFGFNGAVSWATWGGTSRSAPVVAGNLALLYQAYKDRYGEWPTWDKVIAMTKSAATNSVSSPFLQGAGVVNADRMTDLAAGIYGVYSMPDEWQVGDWEGVDYLNFAHVAWPNTTYTKTFTIENPSGYNITVNLSDGVMTRIGSQEYTFTTSDISQESGFNFHAPDYLMELPSDIIPSDAEVMIVRYVHPYDEYDPDRYYSDPGVSGSWLSSWRFMVYNWKDINGDGKLWEDLNGNGVVNHADLEEFDNDGFARVDYDNSEIQEGEYIRMDYEFGGLGVPIFIHNPLERMQDGYFFGFQHRRVSALVPTTTFKIGVEFYKRADWPWISLSSNKLTVPAEGSATFVATAAIPANALPGVYEGVIFMHDPGTYWHDPHESAIPVVVNVIDNLHESGLTFGSRPMEDTMYQNGYTNGYFNWYGGGWTGAGDWRHFFFNVDENALEKSNLLIHTSWANEPTDFNTWVLGPTEDCASNGADPCAWYEPGIGQPDPTVFGPYTLQPIGSSEPFRAAAAYPFNTSTGGPDDWLKVPLENTGLHAVALHNVLYAGKDLYEPFSVEMGTISMEPVIDPDLGTAWTGSIDALLFDDSGKFDIEFTPTLSMPDLNATLAGGLETQGYGPFTDQVFDSGGAYSPWVEVIPNNTYKPIVVTQPGATNLTVHAYVSQMPGGGQDVDMFLVLDNNNNGVANQGVDTLVGSSGNASGVDEEISINNPIVGAQYLVVFDGFDVNPSPNDLDWEYSVTYPGGIPSEEADVFNEAVEVGQDDPLDPTTASFSMVVTTSERTNMIHAELTGIPAGSDADLYLTDADGNIVAKSQTTGSADEALLLMPPDGEYRFGEGATYTVWVHGFKVPTPPMNPTLHVWTNELNIWLSTPSEDVTVSAIDPGETAVVTLHFDKEGWAVGDPALSARLLVGSSVLPNAFDELVTLERSDPITPEWDPANLSISITPTTDRGPAPFYRWTFGDGTLADTALVGPGEDVVYTVEVTNNDPLESPYLIIDAWPIPENYFTTYFGPYPGFNAVDGVAYSLISGTDGTVDYGGGISWEGVMQPGDTVTFSYSVTMPDDMPAPGDHDSGVDVYVESYANWIGWDMADAYNRPFSLSATSGFRAFSFKDATPSALPGDQVTYLISLLNPSSEDKILFVTDPLPEEVTFVSASAGMTYDANTHAVSWSGVVPGTTLASTDLEIIVQVNADVPYGTLIENTANVAEKFGGDPIASFDAYTLVGYPDVSVSKTVNVLNTAVDNTVKYTITIENESNQPALNVVVRDVIPAHLEVDEGSITGGAAFADGVLSWTGDLAVGEKHTITFEAKVLNTAGYGTLLLNAAQVSIDGLPVAYNSAVTEVFSMLHNWLPFLGREGAFTKP